MIKVYVNVSSTWRRIYNTEIIALTYEIGGRIPSFSFSLPDRNFLFSIFNTESPYTGFLKKGNQVKIIKDDLTIARGYIDKPDWQYPEQLVTVQCKGTLAKLQEDNFQGTDWSYKSGTFSLSIPGSRYVDMSSYNATAVWELKVNGKFFWSYEWNAVEQKIIITDDSTGIISGKYLAAVSPHDFLDSLLSDYDIALVPLIHGNDDYVFSSLNLASGAELDGIDEELEGTGEIITRPIDLGKYTTSFGTATFDINGLVSASIRGGDKRNTVISNSWKEITSETNLNSIFGRFVRFVQFKFIINEGEGENSVTINLTGNAPNIEKIKFENENKFTALQRLADCYQCYMFEDRFGTLRMEHKETTEDWEDTLDYLKFTGMKVEGNYSPKRVNVNGLEQKFTWLTGDMAGTEYTIKHKGAVEFEGDDLTGEVNIENKFAWSESILQNVGLNYQPPLTKLRLNTNKEWELGDLVKVQTNYFEPKNLIFSIRFVDVVDSTVPFVDVEDTEYPFLAKVLLEANAIYRVSAKIYRDELTWDYELEEVYRLPFKFYNLYEYYSTSYFDYYEDIIVSTEPETTYVWDGEDWINPDYDHNPETGEVTIPNLTIPEIETPDIPLIPGESIPEKPIVVIHPPQVPIPDWQSYTPDGINQYRWFWDVWNCDYPLHDTVEKHWWDLETGELGYYGERRYSIGLLEDVCSVGMSGNNIRGQFILGYKEVGGEEKEKFDVVGKINPENFTVSGPARVTSWEEFLSLIAGQGNSILFESGYSGIKLMPSFTQGKMYKDDGTPTSLDENWYFNIYAITVPFFINGSYTYYQTLSKELVCTIHIWKPSGVPHYFSVDGDPRYTTIKALMEQTLPFYGLYFKVDDWYSGVDDYYYLKATNATLHAYFALENDINSSLVAQSSIYKIKSGFYYQKDHTIYTGTDTEGWPNRPEYFFKLWRGYTFEARFKYSKNILDFYYNGLRLHFYDFSDGRYNRYSEIWIDTLSEDGAGNILEGLKIYKGYNDDEDLIATVDNGGQFNTLRVVMLGILSFKEINEYDGISIWEEGELSGFEDYANVEYFKDVHDSKVRFKEDPEFTGYVAIYLDGTQIWVGDLDEFCTGKDFSTNKMLYASMRLRVSYMQEGVWYFDYIKMTDKAMDLQSGFDVEHIVLKS